MLDYWILLTKIESNLRLILKNGNKCEKIDFYFVGKFEVLECLMIVLLLDMENGYMVQFLTL